MVRKGSASNKNEALNRSESSGRIRKTPVVVLDRLNIPLDGVVLLRGESIIYPKNSSSSNPQASNIIDITISDDDSSEDTDLQALAVKRFQSTQDNSIYNKSESFDYSKRSSAVCNESKSQEFSKESPFLSKPPQTIQVIKCPPKKKSMDYSKDIKENVVHMAGPSGKISKNYEQKRQIQMRNAARKLVSSESLKHKERTYSLNGSTSMKSVTLEKASLIKNKSSGSGKINRSNNNLNHDSQNKHKSPREVSRDTDDKTSPSSEKTDNRGNIGNIPNHLSDITTITPSRISQRIKNKKVKFSALKLLAGEDLPWKDSPTNEKKIPSPKKPSKAKRGINTADINANNSKTISAHKERPIVTLNAELRIASNTSLSATDSSGTSPSEINKGVPAPELTSPTNVKVPISKESEEISNQDSNQTLQKDCSSKEKELGNDIIDVPENIINTSPTTENTALNGSKEIIVKPSTSNQEDSGEIRELNKKMRLKLEGPLQKKIVNISVSPFKNAMKKQDSQKGNVKHKLDVELGPDIIIKRIKSGKNLLGDVVNSAEKQSPLISKEKDSTKRVEGVSSPITNEVIPVLSKVDLFPDDSVITTLRPQKEMKIPPQIKKIFEETSKNKKSLTKSDELVAESRKANYSEDTIAKLAKATSLFNRKRKKNRELKKKKPGIKSLVKNKSPLKGQNEINSKKDYENTSDVDLVLDDNEPAEAELPNSPSALIENTFGDSESSVELNDKFEKRTPKIALKINSQSREIKLGDKRSSKDVDFASPNVVRVGGKKTAKVTPLRQVNKLPPKSEVIKNSNEKISSEKDLSRVHKSKTVPKLTSPAELCVLDERRNFKNAFEKYFICTEKICEHNDSLDSDSGDDAVLLSHFIDLKRGKNNKELVAEEEEKDDNEDGNRTENILSEEENPEDSPTRRIREKGENNFISSREKGTINEVIKGITADLPKWNWHVLPESSIVCLVLLDRDSGILDVKKCIEIDCNFKAKVYVNKMLVNEYCGVYDGFDAIKNLIYQVDLL